MSGTEQPILLLTHSGDFYTIDRVVEALAARGAECLRINTDEFPSQLYVTSHFGAQGSEHWLQTPERRIALHHVPAIWSRRLWPGAMPDSMEAKYAQRCARSARTALLDAFALLDTAFWINPLRAAQVAESKIVNQYMRYYLAQTK